MKIRQLEQATGLDRATIRFYEKEGLSQPQRQENGYREYERSDQDALLKIKLLRQLGISLESIKKLQQGRVMGQCIHSDIFHTGFLPNGNDHSADITKPF